MVQNEPRRGTKCIAEEKLERRTMTAKQYLETFMPLMYKVYESPPWGIEKYLQTPAVDFRTATQEKNNKYKVLIDVRNFKEEDISVKTAKGFLIVNAFHEEKMDQAGLISRNLTRKYKLPEGVDLDAVRSRLSPYGVLTVTALAKPPPMTEGGRYVHIELTGPVRNPIRKI